MNIHDFLRLFKTRYIHTGSSEDLALKLYDQFIPPHIRTKIGKSRSYKQMELQLKSIFGTPIALARIEMVKVQKLSIPQEGESSML